MKRIAALLLVLTLTAAATPQWDPLGPGLSETHLTTAAQGDVIVFKADANRFTLRTIVNRTPDRADAMRKRTGAVLVVNGPFFDPDRKPMGLLIADGKQLQPLAPAAPWSGCVLGVRNDRLFIETRDGVQLEGVTQAVQCAPRLLVGGHRTDKILDADVVARRTGVGMTQHGDILVWVTPPWIGGVSLKELQQLLLKAGAWDAMCLDGGASTQMALQAGAHHQVVDAPDAVPVGIGLFPKKR